jgi:hypothetical protein
MIHKDDIDQQRANTLKTIRALIRLKHSIAADEELNEKLPLAQSKFDSAILRGQLPSPADIRKAVGV